MKRFAESEFLYQHLWSGWRRFVLISLCLAALLLLGVLRTATDAEFAFASLALIPVLVVAWIGGKSYGLSMAAAATAMWIIADLSSTRTFSPDWIPWANAAIRMVLYGLVAGLAAQVRTQLDREHQHATCDALTGLNNRRFFISKGNAEVERARRYKSAMTILFLDLDNFKSLNDTVGHHAGDAALQATAKALRLATRGNDLVCRLGGDEFAVMLPEVGYEAAQTAGRKIFEAVNTALNEFPPVRGSMGVAWFEEPDKSFEFMLNEADHLMYTVKATGKNNLLSKRFSETRM